jgi:hypothetical protein
MDFWFLTDHYDRLGDVEGLPPGVPAKKEWDSLRESARAKTEDGKFIAMTGWEWSPAGAHMNMLNDEFAPPDPLSTRNYQLMIKWFEANPGAITGFNHPKDGMSWLFFNNYKLVPSIASQTVYIEVNTDDDMPYYYKVLDNGWRVAPASVHDNHDRSWGLRDHLVAVYADALTYGGIIEALRARRFYGTTERDMELRFDANGATMGGEITADKIDFVISVKKPEGKDISSVQLITNKKRIIREWTPVVGDFNEKVTLPAGFEGTRWFVVLARTSDGKFSISAPIWAKKR